MPPMGMAMPPELAAQLTSALSQAMSGAGPGIGMMVMGVGENERGKRVAKAASVEFDADGRVLSRDYHESQLDPDDPMLATTREPVDDSDVIEVTLEDCEPAAIAASGDSSRSS
jgi:hypothetical protein